MGPPPESPITQANSRTFLLYAGSIIPKALSMSSKPREPIAIIGTGCRFSGGANTASKLWDLLKEPCDVSREIPSDRFSIDRFYHPTASHHGTTNVRRSYFLTEDVSYFDTRFFAIPPGEAEAIDPQQRLLLEVTYEAIDSAGLTLKGLHGSDTAIYVGIMSDDYRFWGGRDVDLLSTYNDTGTASSNASSRASYFFDWHGPSMTIDTACSSSLVALHEAVQALRNGTSRIAVAAGTNLLLSPLAYVTQSNLNMLSPEGRCHMWDEAADGYARGEGVAAIVLKTLSAAIQDGDHIECVIREIGINHDGRTPGLTMPSASAQASLIRQVYSRAGLDPLDPNDRCQYFEAHGTGTPAGDPQEAEALSLAFFHNHNKDMEDDILYVGSVKTVIGHTEGTAGLAGLLKACMALKHSVIPPNLHFSRLSRKVAPFASHLRVPTKLEPWPKVQAGAPRRASVNSFGFGGANAHAILESYEPLSAPVTSSPSQIGEEPMSSSSSASSVLSTYSDTISAATSLRFDTRATIPFVFSAATEQSLVATLRSFSSYFTEHGAVDPVSIAHTLSSKKSALSCRVAFPTSSIERLLQNLNDTLGAVDRIENSIAAQVSAPASILGIFTGQGAQWATMGATLLESIPIAKDIFEDLDRSLSALPEDHRPRWTLVREVMAEKTSRIGEAEISQPICTAVQILLVDLLKRAGVRFTAVVGHSSGEIAAAYASGFIDKSDAIRIAYYRGYFASFASSSSGERGAMMATGIVLEEAQDICSRADFSAKLCIAAHNSRNSVTLSGDLNAIEGAKAILDKDEKFARLLKVDTAYHSHHMLPCSGPYLKAIQACNIKVLHPPEDAPMWFSSVHDGKLMGSSLPNTQYWVDNLTRPVLFHQALKNCLQCPGFNVNFTLEIGPHPALKGPVTDTIKEVIGKGLNYCGTLSRGRDDLEALTEALGCLWATLGPAAIDLGQFERSCYGEYIKYQSVTDLPSYPWHHDKQLWFEARSCRADRLQDTQYHDLLGKIVSDGGSGQWEWKNLLKVKELPWLSDHALQGQPVFPATGYIALAMEAAMQVAGKQPVRHIELCNLKFSKAIAINDTLGTELHVKLTRKPNLGTDTKPSALFDFVASSAVASKEFSSMALNCSGEVHILYEGQDEVSGSLLPSRGDPPVNMSPVNLEQFYSALRDDLGYVYEGLFQNMTSLYRKPGHSTGTIKNIRSEDRGKPLLFHPALGDCALQGMYATMSSPGDGMLWSILVPSACRRVTLIPSLCGSNMTEEVAFDCNLVKTGDRLMPGNVSVYSAGFKEKIIQFEGLSFVPFAAATSKDDRCMFQESLWCTEKPDGHTVLGDRKPSDLERQKALDCERAAFFYLKNLHLSVNIEARSTLPWYRQAMLEYAGLMYEKVQTRQHEYANDWLNDTHDEMLEMMDSYGDDPDFNLTRAVGENLPRPQFLSGDESILECMTKNDYLARYYEKALGFDFSNESVARLVAQLVTKFPAMHFCEIGAGTGSATKPVMDTIGDAFASYTYTDISNVFFEAGREKLAAHQKRIVFKTLDIENDPISQGFALHSFDCIIAANVLHATKSLENTLHHVRSLLKPGGYLVLYECMADEVMRLGMVMGGLPGWWIGREDGRRWAPTVTLSEWDSLLKRTGFSGIETSTPIIDKISVPHAIFCTMAYSEDVRMLQDPLAITTPSRSVNDTLILLGGKTSTVATAIQQLISEFQSHFKTIVVMESLDSVEMEVMENSHIISLVDCEGAIFENMAASQWTNLQNLFQSPRSIVWVTCGAHSWNPYAAMSAGVLRNLYYEMPGTHIHLLDFEAKAIKVEAIAKLALQVQIMDCLKEENADTILWTVEPELRFQGDKLQMRRIRPQHQQNSRLNSSRRPITHVVDSQNVSVQLEAHGDSYALKENYEAEIKNNDSAEHVAVQVSTSVVSSIKTPAGFAYVCLGKTESTGESVLCLSDTNSSRVFVHKSWTFPTGLDQVVDRQYLSFVVGFLISQMILRVMPETGSLLGYEPDIGFASLLSKQISLRGMSTFFITSQSEDLCYRLGNWRYIHGKAPSDIIKAAIPSDVSLYVDASTESLADSAGNLASWINSTLPTTCERLKLASLTSAEASKLPQNAPESIVKLLEDATGFASVNSNGIPDGAPLDYLPLKAFVS
ncbi:Type I Iterative PKS, partial [Arthroderma sp. PD_2]